MRSGAVPLGIYLTVAACCFARAAPAGDAPPAVRETAGVPRAAVWKAQRVDFFYVGRTSRYSCDGLRDKVRAMLIDLGARRDPTVIAVGCPGDDRKSSAPVGLRLKIEFVSPAFSAAAGRSALTGEAAAVEARFQPFRITSDAFRNMGVGDCELVQQFSQQILPRFTVRALNQDIVCVPYQPSASRFLVRGEILKALPPDAGR
jgi:hypothetical protein